ncbi:MAG: GldG family protein, partial [bacterium]|nr:GldG family protein [bacterium]
FIGINVLLSFFPLRFDYSYGQAYTLSNSTKNILKKLDNNITIKFYASSDLPTRLQPLKTEVSDMLSEYKKQNTGKITYKILDPKKDQTAGTEVKEFGIPELQFSQLDKDKYAVSSSYFGIAIINGDKNEILPQVTDIESFEYNITASIYKLTRKEMVKVGIIGQEESFDPQNENLSILKNVLKQQFDLSFIDISSKSKLSEIDSSYKTILIFDTTKKEFEEQEMALLKKFIQNKGNVIFFVDGVWVGDALDTTPAKHNLFSLLQDYGVKVNNDLVLSTSAELVNFGNNTISFLSPYPFWIKTNNFDQKSSYFSNISQLTFPWASSISVEKKQNITVNELIKSTNKSWLQSGTFELNPQKISQPQANNMKEILLGVDVQKKNEGKILVISSSRFILDRYMTRISDNMEFILNSVNNFASSGALSGIRQRSISFYPLPDVTDNEKDMMKYSNILLLPILFAIFGAIRLIKRK